MDVFDEIALHKDSLTPAEQAVSRIVQEHPDAILGCTSNELARRFGVSQSAVSRFCQKLGFAGYGEFRMELHKTLTLRSFGGDAEPEDRISCLTRLMQAVSDAVGPETFASFYGRIEKARNVYVFGAGQSSIPARMLAGRLLEDSIPARYVALGYETEVLH
ncbi:MAG: MurR/RpiR family transcriptional regulator, partial [Olsenella sp.]|nr:MurR/RpiR family transcriptional regulator [Olsenella sp.]